MLPIDKEITLENISDKLDDWTTLYGHRLSFEAKQALIPIRDFLWAQNTENKNYLTDKERKYDNT